MPLIIHIIIALSSIIYTTHVYFQPSRQKLYGSYVLIAATLGSGAYLVISTHSSLLSSCVSGLVYLGIALSGTFFAYRKLAKRPF